MVGATNRSVAAMSGAWLRRKVRHPREGGPHRLSIDKFRALPDAAAKQVALSKVDSWKRRDEFPKELVTLPGETFPSSALVDACSALLLAPKAAALQ